jgi:hypothetical protein
MSLLGELANHTLQRLPFPTSSPKAWATVSEPAFVSPEMTVSVLPFGANGSCVKWKVAQPPPTTARRISTPARRMFMRPYTAQGSAMNVE